MARRKKKGPQFHPKLAEYQMFVVDGLTGKVALDGTNTLVWILNDWIDKNGEALAAAHLTFLDFLAQQPAPAPQPPSGPRRVDSLDTAKRKRSEQAKKGERSGGEGSGEGNGNGA